MTRRQALLWLASASSLRAQYAPRFRGLDHIEFTVTDVERSVAFYTRLFGGADVMKNRQTTRRYIKLGSSYMAIDRADSPRIDHVCLGIEDFDITAAHEWLTAKGIMYRDYPSGRDTGLNDPDGTRLQLATADGWTALAAQTAVPEPRVIRSAQIFEPLYLWRAEIGVSNMAAALEHYGRFLQPAIGRSFSVANAKLDLVDGPAGYRKFTVCASPKGFDEAAIRLRELGVPTSTGLWGMIAKDPDGLEIEFVPPVAVAVA